MKVLVYGTGGRDHSLADKYGDSQHVENVIGVLKEVMNPEGYNI
ncbi:unnamed protein product, partial [marine sediment metagenome]